jgi:hypothetical protein
VAYPPGRFAAERVVEEADHAARVFLRPHLEAARVSSLGDFQYCFGCAAAA